jgi:hypothetical protein
LYGRGERFRCGLATREVFNLGQGADDQRQLHNHRNANGMLTELNQGRQPLQPPTSYFTTPRGRGKLPKSTHSIRFNVSIAAGSLARKRCGAMVESRANQDESIEEHTETCFLTSNAPALPLSFLLLQTSTTLLLGKMENESSEATDV